MPGSHMAGHWVQQPHSEASHRDWGCRPAAGPLGRRVVVHVHHPAQRPQRCSCKWPTHCQRPPRMPLAPALPLRCRCDPGPSPHLVLCIHVCKAFQQANTSRLTSMMQNQSCDLRTPTALISFQPFPAHAGSGSATVCNFCQKSLCFTIMPLHCIGGDATYIYGAAPPLPAIYISSGP